MNYLALRSFALQLAILLVVPASPCLAWNPPGHMIIALVAYNQLDAATRAKAVALLRDHPRFADHFDYALARDVRKGTDAEKDEWVFAFAATWPDVVRSAHDGVTREDVQQYSRPWWHFVDLPIYLDDAARQELAPKFRLNVRRDPGDDPNDPDMNVIQAIKSASKIVSDPASPRELQSTRLCWLLHLVGDSHQPLHSSALFTAHRYPGGDHGGNFLNHSHGYTLHSFWDEQICNDESYDTINLLAKGLSRNAELAAEGERAAAQLDPGAWIDEGHELAKKYVYSPEVMQKVAAREGHAHLGDLNPSPQYDADAETVAERQAIIAGHRLAKLLSQLLK